MREYNLKSKEILKGTLMNNTKKGIFYIILSALGFATMSLFVQLAGDGVPFMQKTLFRNIVATIFSFGLIIKQGGDFSFKKENLKFLLMRASFGTISMFLNFYAIDNLILADASTIAKLSPFFVIIFSFFILRERIRIWQIVSIIVAFIGSIFIINPNIIISIFVNVPISSTMTTIPALAGFFGAMTAGLAYTFIRKLSIGGERGPFIIFFFSAFSMVACLPFVVFNFVPMTLTELLFLLGAGVAASLGQFGVTSAYAHAPAKDISVYDYSQIVFSALYSFFIFGVLPSGYSVIGYVIIISVAVFIFIRGNSRVVSEDSGSKKE